MKKWVTEILALDPVSGHLKTYGGPHIDAPTWEEATSFCQANGLGYCRVVGQLIAEVDETTGVKADYDNLN